MGHLNGFDPLNSLVTAQFERPAELGEVNLRVLTPFQRALLVIDGTVTKFLEAHTMEPMEIVRLGQGRHALEADHQWLDAVYGTEVIVRQVLIQGKYSRTPHVFAVSLIVLDRLDGRIREALEEEGGGIGRILNDATLETRREILWYGREHADDLPEPVRQRAGTEFISRSYRIITGGKPIALINERFPFAVDRLPAHH